MRPCQRALKAGEKILINPARQMRSVPAASSQPAASASKAARACPLGSRLRLGKGWLRVGIDWAEASSSAPAAALLLTRSVTEASGSPCGKACRERLQIGTPPRGEDSQAGGARERKRHGRLYPEVCRRAGRLAGYSQQELQKLVLEKHHAGAEDDVADKLRDDQDKTRAVVLKRVVFDKKYRGEECCQNPMPQTYRYPKQGIEEVDRNGQRGKDAELWQRILQPHQREHDPAVEKREHQPAEIVEETRR